MVWYRGFGLTEIILACCFLIFYALYVIRVVRVGRMLKSSVMNLLIKLAVRTALFGLLIIAVLGPSFGDMKKEVKSVGKDIMICVDLSKSMDAFDIQPTRLEKVKFEMKRIVDAFSSDRVGVVIFSSEAYMQCPLTFDQNALHLFIETMNSSLVPASGTDFGPALRLALDKLEGDQSNASQQNSKIIVLISDGEDFGEDTNDVAYEIENKGIKLFALGVGTEKGGNIYYGNGLKKDQQGDVVTSKLNVKSLRSIADKTGGQYFEINDSQNDVAKMINTIGSIEGEIRDARMIDVSANRYYYFLVAALVLILVDILVNVKTIHI